MNTFAYKKRRVASITPRGRKGNDKKDFFTARSHKEEGEQVHRYLLLSY